MKRVLTVGLRCTDEPIDGIEFDNLGLCGTATEHGKSAPPSTSYVIINPASCIHRDTSALIMVSRAIALRQFLFRPQGFLRSLV
ncbi:MULTISPECIES: hypothetical protein [unclassified Pseudomonas]|uniref:hypothetical protein n=1 Tax=unclassified Pseudomonas TaxID=196821 RepID=UPI0011A76D7F|nr:MULTISPECIES: hypothetical protein [unclassified Pseudomonas]TWC17348.1 hypothetical protein FBY00_10923 [Pseudomonas sp. SJZ075]TWC33895.1 hypothetical protein FBY02_108163 [Pseudomonas sp. SJZ078]TWC54847.1 hypothetical protein FBY11_109163 [Pseudomonas sp. SJZ124]TWC88591.1 hypothetical protein FBY09_10923 [Pseudomonas sp. SJZ101]